MGGDEPDDLTPQQQASFNRINQTTPFGSIRFTHDQGGPRLDPSTATVTLDPAVQAVVDQQLMSALLAGQRGTGLLQDAPAGLDASRMRVEQAAFDRALGLLNPELDRREEALRQRLANQGLPQASRAFESEVGRFETGRNEALQQAALQAVLAGGAEETRQMNIIAQLLGLTQAQQPTFFAPGAVATGGGVAGGLSPAMGVTSGALSGAAAGTAVYPGIGTAVGAIGGGLLGYLGTQ